MTQSEKADALLALHTGDEPLVLPNIWNPIGARILEAHGHPAVATASAALSASLGYADGERISRSTLIDLLARIVRSVAIPVTADIETGFGECIAELEETVALVLDAGVVGINLEDSLCGKEGVLRPIAAQRQRIAACTQSRDQEGRPPCDQRTRRLFSLRFLSRPERGPGRGIDPRTGLPGRGCRLHLPVRSR